MNYLRSRALIKRSRTDNRDYVLVLTGRQAEPLEVK